MIIFTEVVSPRLEYMVRFLTSFFGNKVSLTTVRPNNTSVYINYSKNAAPNSIQIIPHHLLFEDNILPQNIDMGVWNAIPAFFKTNKNSIVDFDIFAATFFMISRYEEYLPFKADQHGRFPASESIAFKNNFLDIPLVDEWLLALVNVFNQHKGNFKTNRKYSFIQTVDIDKAYAYTHQAFPFNILLLAKSLIKGASKEYTHVLQKTKKDPFDVYSFLEEEHRKYKAKSIYFIQSGKRGTYDKNLPIQSEAMKDLLGGIKKSNSIGIHPSYASFNNGKTMKKETDALSAVLGDRIHKSRQHFLRLSFPDTFRILENIGIKEEYSMGFADHPGFRAGTCTPYLHYDLELECETDLTIFSLILMDVTLSRYLKLNTDEAIEKSNELIERVKEVDGCFISLWHNSSFCALHEMEGWDVVFKAMMKKAAVND